MLAAAAVAAQQQQQLAESDGDESSSNEQEEPVPASGNKSMSKQTKKTIDFFENKIGAFVDMYARVGVDLDFFTPTKTTSLQSVLPYLKAAAKTICIHWL